MSKRKYDFAGWVTKNDIKCSDGVTIKHDAFKGNHDGKVPLVWNHNHKEPTNILGHMLLQNKPEGVYGQGFFNDTEEARHAKALISHGDISAMSIGANKIKKRGLDVIHGMIYEVSLVLAGANPGAMIESIITHSDTGEEIEHEDKAIIYSGNVIHSAEQAAEIDQLEHEDGGKDDMPEKTIGEVMDTMNEEQMAAVEALLANVIEQSDDLNQSDEGGEDMKHNVFGGQQEEQGEELTHALQMEVFADAQKFGSLRDSMLEHGITGIETLFPEAHNLNPTPFMYMNRNTNGAQIVNGVTKSPFSRIKTRLADFTEEAARAKGYIKGAEKFEQVFTLASRTTTPQTIYKKQKLDRDDIIDITDFDVVTYINAEMKLMLMDEIGRAILVGDGRTVGHADKIKAEHIRPIISDDDFYTIKKEALTHDLLIEVIIKAMAEYEGSGSPTMYMHPVDVANLKLLKADDGRFLFGDIPSAAAIAARFGVKEIVESTFLKNTILIVNLADYTLGATKGGEITNFDDFDIDFNQYKYLIETRLSGALVLPKSAISINIGTPLVVE